MTPDAVTHFESRLAFETDVSDVAAALSTGDPAIVVVDTRSKEAWDQGHVPGAVHLPGAGTAERAAELIDPAADVVTYCWGPGCNGATKGALALARLGYRVREMLGGYEYWVREGLATEGARGHEEHPVDPLTAPVSAVTCDC